MKCFSFQGHPQEKTQFSQLTARLPQSYDYRISFLLTRTWFIYHWTQAPVLRITLHKRLRVCAPRDFHSHHCSPRGLLREQRSTPAHSNTAASSTPGGAIVNTRGRLTQPLSHFSPLLRDFHIILTEHIKVSRAAGPLLLSKKHHSETGSKSLSFLTTPYPGDFISHHSLPRRLSYYSH